MKTPKVSKRTAFTQPDVHRRLLISPTVVEMMAHYVLLGTTNRQLIADALFICNCDVLVAHRLFRDWLTASHEFDAQAFKARLVSSVSLLDYMRTHLLEAQQVVASETTATVR